MFYFADCIINENAISHIEKTENLNYDVFDNSLHNKYKLMIHYISGENTTIYYDTAEECDKDFEYLKNLL